MELKDGYKKVGAGVFPEDWDYKLVGDFSVVSSGGTPSRQTKEYWKGKIPWITTTLIDFKTILKANEFITQEGLKNSAAKLYKKGTILMAMYGQGKTRGKVGILGIGAAINQACAAIVLNDTIDKHYVFLNLSSRYDEIRALSNTGNQENLNGELIKRIPILLPKRLSEQKAIAQVLSDTDKLIQSLEKKIAKKKLIKQGIMQQLLTPKDGWLEYYIRDLGTPYGGLSGKNKDDFTNGNSKYIPFMTVMRKPIIAIDKLNFVRISNGEAQNKVVKGDLIFNGSSETPNELGMCSVLTHDVKELYLNSFCFGFRLHNQDQHDSLFLSYYFRSVEGRRFFFSLAQGATRYNLSKSNFMKSHLRLPDIQKQKESSKILYDLDIEIDTTIERLDKIKTLKVAMMQQLLTGKIRLSCPEK